MVSIRKITNQQFSDGTTIDGDRLERAIQDLEEYIDDVPYGDFRQRWLQTQVIMKYLPPTAQVDANLITSSTIAGNSINVPFLPVYNFGPGITNAYRLKGNKLPYQEAFNAGGYGTTQVAWTCNLAFADEPVIIAAVDAVLLSYSSEYINNFEYDSAPPPNKVLSQPIDNIHLEITMDNPFIPNIQILNSVLWHKYNFSAHNSKITARGLAYPNPIPSDMDPKMSSITGMGNGGQASLAIQERDLNIPVPPMSRIRFSLILPDDGFAPWDAKPWQTVVPTLSLTLLERLKSD
mgnify:CR=1 FL=1